MAQRFVVCLLGLIGFLAVGGRAHADSPHIVLGPQQAFPDQPYVDIELFDAQGNSLGPDGGGGLLGTGYNSFLLDTGANGILAVDAAAQSLESNGYETEAEFIEKGVAGDTIYDVSSPYRLDFSGTDGIAHTLPRASDDVRLQSSPLAQLGGPVDWGGIPGLVGMPAMTDRVTTLDMSHWSTITDILDFDPMKVTFPTSVPSGAGIPVLPADNGHRYSVSVDNRLAFDAADGRPDWEDPDSPLPTYADVPFMTGVLGHHDAEDNPVSRSGTFLFDTGAQFSLISRSMAFSLGLDANGDGNLDDDAIDFVDVGGVGGTIRAPLLLVDEFRLPTDQGVDLVWKPTDPEDLGLQFLVLDILPVADASGDGRVGGDDLDIIRANWGKTVTAQDLPSGDLSGDGFVGADDLDLVRSQWGEDCFIDGVFGVDLLTGGLAIDLYGISGDPWFQKVHFDFRDWDSGDGTLFFDLTPELDVVVGGDLLEGDLNGDGFVGGDDLDLIRAHWGETVAAGDLLAGDPSGDGFVGGDDLDLVRSHWGEGTPPSPSAVPEPNAAASLLFILAAGAWGIRRNRRPR